MFTCNARVDQDANFASNYVDSRFFPREDAQGRTQGQRTKGLYRVRNWREYNTGLIARGDVTMWIDQSVLTQGSEADPTRRGRPTVYSDAAIQTTVRGK